MSLNEFLKNNGRKCVSDIDDILNHNCEFCQMNIFLIELENLIKKNILLSKLNCYDTFSIRSKEQILFIIKPNRLSLCKRYSNGKYIRHHHFKSVTWKKIVSDHYYD